MAFNLDQPSPGAAAGQPKRIDRPNRQRASVACLHCRNRKIRCDVSRRGCPCANCRLDDTECVVVCRSGAKPSALPKPDVITPPQTDCTSNGRSSILSSTINSTTDLNDTLPVWEVPLSNDTVVIEQISETINADNSRTCEIDLMNLPSGLAPDSRSVPDAETVQFRPWDSSLIREGRGDILYTYHPFLSQNDLSHLSPRDLNLLESQSCLRVPTRPILHEFIRQYFLYVHPLLPMMDEAAFWRTYRGEDHPNEHIPLLLIQAMLFVASNHVSSDIIGALGFSSNRSARAEFYRRAKILYDMDAELSSFTISQAALLLTSWTPPANPRGRKPNTLWLSIAIEHARAEGAHLYENHPDVDGLSKHQALGKRIWWCCIIRDRLLSLGLRRRIQIDRETFDFDTKRRLNHSDLAGEVDASRVYCTKAKISLIRILLRVVDLCVSLTDLLSLAHCLESSRNGETEYWLSYLNRVRRIKTTLRLWHDVTKSEFSSSLEQVRSASKYDEQCKAVAVHLHMMYMYYHSAAISLAHYEILLITMVIPTGTPYTVLRPSYLSKLFYELQSSSGSLAECLEGLLKEDLIQLLPISTIALLVIPLVHHILDLYTAHDDSYTAEISRKNRLDALVEAMNKFQLSYDGVEWVNSILRKALDLGDARLSEVGKDREWRRDLPSSPAPYLRIAFTVEFSLSRSKYLQETDVPEYLERVFKDIPGTILGCADPMAMTQQIISTPAISEPWSKDLEKLLEVEECDYGDDSMIISESASASVVTPPEEYPDIFDSAVIDDTP